jgi:EAL domain-containing protein (putative c-di-GMP-specific phosphodiesterase class I)
MLEDLDTNPEGAVIHARIAGNKIKDAMNEPYLLGDNRVYHCSASIGITLFSDHLVAEEELLKHADIAMYQAKHAGRNTLCFFDQEMQTLLIKRAELEEDLRIALKKNQFELYYQPQMTTHSHQIIGAEVLLRWQHPERGLILPMEFIPLAEETGLILPIGQWVLETACAQLKTWKNKPQTQRLQLAINVSALQFHQIDFVEQVRIALKKTAADPNRLKLELTESMVLKDVDNTIVKMQTLKAIGVNFSMDDFGTGNASLSYLTQLPFDQIKIDRSFVCNISIKHTDAVIMQTIIGMANNLGIEIIAEGVETEAQRAFLERHGCSLCQGYLFSKPVSVEEFEQMLQQNP